MVEDENGEDLFLDFRTFNDAIFQNSLKGEHALAKNSVPARKK